MTQETYFGVAPTSSPLDLTSTVASSTLTAAGGSAYTGTVVAPQLVASSATAASVVVPSFNLPEASGAVIPQITLSTDATSGWGGTVLLVTLWTAAPTYTNGDGGTYAVATGSAGQRQQFTVVLQQMADGAVGQGAALVGSSPFIVPAAGTSIYWDIQIENSATPIVGQTFTLTPQIWN